MQILGAVNTQAKGVVGKYEVATTTIIKRRSEGQLGVSTTMFKRSRGEGKQGELCTTPGGGRERVVHGFFKIL